MWHEFYMLVHISIIKLSYDVLKRGSRTWRPLKGKWNKVHDYFNVSLKNANFSKWGYNSLIKGWAMKKNYVTHYITYLGFKYEKLSHEERCINSVFDARGRIKILIPSFVINYLSEKASFFVTHRAHIL
jgi:hypothetical protein